ASYQPPVISRQLPATSRQPPAASRQEIEPQSRKVREESDQSSASSLQCRFAVNRDATRQPSPFTGSWRLEAFLHLRALGGLAVRTSFQRSASSLQSGRLVCMIGD
ncbi:MAG: hypothetical protein J7D61_09670, partial [Marichromatium sp.]|nr:hypothetical protein [Marichromatium sp.]